MATIYVATTGSDTTGTGSSGNPYATPGKAAGVKANGDTVIINPGTYTVTTSTANVSNGCINDNVSGSDGGYTNKWIGVGTVIIKAGTGMTATLFNPSCYNLYVENITFDASSNGSWCFYTQANYAVINNCVAKNGGYGFVSQGNPRYFRCSSYSNTIGVWSVGGLQMTCCVIRNNSSYGVNGNSTYNNRFDSCIAYNNGGCGFGSTDAGSAFGDYAKNCIAYGNASSGFKCDGTYARSPVLEGCIAYGNGGYGIVGNGNAVCLYCATGSNTSGGVSNVSIDKNPIILTADPFNSASTGDFNLNSTAGGGALLVPSAVNFAMPW